VVRGHLHRRESELSFSLLLRQLCVRACVSERGRRLLSFALCVGCD
jgi:hypothetical protein